MSTSTANQPRKRVPNGVDSARPIALRLKPSELELVKQRAQKEHRSMASVCRLAVLRGLGNDEATP
ncbi:hypothetical protein [Hydrogenophaga sp.]|uniref:hypothetical protein n=1 Tax=Hydrogenophaga sp. TaxID=1904254 RepID=UPI003F7130F3